MDKDYDVRNRALLICVAIGCVLCLANLWAWLFASPAQLAGDHVTVQESGNRYEVTVRTPTAPVVETGQVDRRGEPIRLRCESCHSVQATATSGATAEKFHRGLMFRHGNLECGACHNKQDDFATLHLADGRSLAFEDTMRLCAQCHGPQHRDYQNGSHGGMTGHWDLTKGPRRRNHCVDCHDVHAPQYPSVHPVAGPNDRFTPLHKEASH